MTECGLHVKAEVTKHNLVMQEGCFPWLTQILQRWLLPSPRRTLCLPLSPEGLKRLGLNRMLAPLQTQGIPQKWEGCQTLEQHRSHLSKTEAKKRGQEHHINDKAERENKEQLSKQITRCSSYHTDTKAFTELIPICRVFRCKRYGSEKCLNAWRKTATDKCPPSLMIRE